MTFVHSHSPRMPYRPDIDGLRAVAVLSVVVFHAFPDRLKGGFIGVDIFFAISGYLISMIIFEGLEQGTFSFSNFYSRRIRRIFPALLLVITISYIFGWFTLLANEYKQLGKHIAGGSGFISNWVLWGESGYFDNLAETKPLLHLWSLGIEEQFYLFYPFLLWFAWKRKFNILIVIGCIACISFYLNNHGVKRDVVSTFFLPQTRFWELMSGSLLAWGTLYGQIFVAKFKEKFHPRWLGFLFKNLNKISDEIVINTTSILGFLLLSYGLFHINKDMSFPGVWALIPIFASLLIIFSGQEAWLNKKILSNPPMVWFGLISFPLYLWHWILLSFLRIINEEQLDFRIRIAAVISSIIFSWLTYRFIEKPLRFGVYIKIKTSGLAFFILLSGFVGYLTYINDGLTFRKDASLQSNLQGDVGHLAYHKYIAEKYFMCTPDRIAKEALNWEGYVRCMQSKSNENVDIALIGDSHVEHLFLGMAEALPEKNIAFYIKNSAPFLNNPEFKTIYDVVINSKSIKTVVVTMQWVGRYAEIPKGSSLDKELINIIDVFSKAGKQVYLTDDVPIFPFAPEKCKGSRRFGKKTVCAISYDEIKSQRKIYLGFLKKVAQLRPAVKILPVGQYICDSKLCNMSNDKFVLYRDYNHLNIPGSLLIGHQLVEDNKRLFG